MIVVILIKPYHIRHKLRLLYASRFDGLEEINHSLSFQSLQLSMDADESTSATNSITEKKEWGNLGLC